MNTDKMAAGPELDRLVAERVMGVRVRKQSGRNRYELVIPGGVNQVDFVDPEAPWSACPPYSTSIAHAWEVVERMAPREMRMGRTEAGRYYVNFDHQPMNAVADTAPLAICRAALKAVGA